MTTEQVEKLLTVREVGRILRVEGECGIRQTFVNML